MSTTHIVAVVRVAELKIDEVEHTWLRLQYDLTPDGPHTLAQKAKESGNEATSFIAFAPNFTLLCLVRALGEETAVQAVVGSIVWAFRRLKKPR